MKKLNCITISPKETVIWLYMMRNHKCLWKLFSFTWHNSDQKNKIAFLKWIYFIFIFRTFISLFHENICLNYKYFFKKIKFFLLRRYLYKNEITIILVFKKSIPISKFILALLLALTVNNKIMSYKYTYVALRTTTNLI